jgi:hypothetical protein
MAERYSLLRTKMTLQLLRRLQCNLPLSVKSSGRGMGIPINAVVAIDSSASSKPS